MRHSTEPRAMAKIEIDQIHMLFAAHQFSYREKLSIFSLVAKRVTFRRRALWETAALHESLTDRAHRAAARDVYVRQDGFPTSLSRRGRGPSYIQESRAPG
jgi:transposase